MNILKTFNFILFHIIILIKSDFINNDDFSLKAIFQINSNNQRISIINIPTE